MDRTGMKVTTTTKAHAQLLLDTRIMMHTALNSGTNIMNPSKRGPEHGGHGPAHLHEARHYEPTHYDRRDIWQRQRAHDWQHEHRSWHERGGYVGYRIPEDRFRTHFGRGHWFRVHDVPVVVVQGSPRFQFGGFWFGVVDPCPETWSPVWYRTDDVYVDYVNDGYYMYNRSHPGIAIAVNVSL